MQVLKDDIYNGILNAAKEMFLFYGYDKTSVEKIAKKAGVSKSNLYNYFKSKDEIFCRLVDSAATHFQNLIKTFYNDEFHPAFEETGFEEMLSQKIFDLICNYKDGLVLLMNYATGSKYENFKDNLINQISDRFIIRYSNGNHCKEILFRIITENLFVGITSLTVQLEDEEQLKFVLDSFIKYHSLGFHALISSK